MSATTASLRHHPTTSPWRLSSSRARARTTHTGPGPSPYAPENARTVNEFGFTGRYLDKETGLWYFRARYYSGSLGRFIGRDPLGYVDGYQLYMAYFIPNHTDSTGTVKFRDPCKEYEKNTEVESDPVYKNYNWTYTKGGLGIDKLTGAILKMVWQTIGSGVGKVVSPADPTRIKQWYVIFTRQKYSWTLICKCEDADDGTKEYVWRYKPTNDGAPTTNVVYQYAGPMLLEEALTGGDPQGNSLVNPGEVIPDGDRAVDVTDAIAKDADYKDK